MLPAVLKAVSLICAGEVSYPVCRWQTETTKVRCVRAVLATCADLYVFSISDAFKDQHLHREVSQSI